MTDPHGAFRLSRQIACRTPSFDGHSGRANCGDGGPPVSPALSPRQSSERELVSLERDVGADLQFYTSGIPSYRAPLAMVQSTIDLASPDHSLELVVSAPAEPS